MTEHRMNCPICGGIVWNGEGPRPDHLCLPITCLAWSTEARYDHATHSWIPVDADGYDLKGQR
jgi:hypothetical protein